MLESHGTAAPPPIKGSVMLAVAASAEEVLAQLREDVYAAEVWDLEKVQIIPVSFFFLSFFLAEFTLWVRRCWGECGGWGDGGMRGLEGIEARA